MAGNVDLVVPVKRLVVAKSRLFSNSGPRGSAHVELVLAMVADTVVAATEAMGVRRVLVVTPDPEVAASVRPFGAETVLDTEESGLNSALRRAAGVVRPANRKGMVGALNADLAALRSEELAAAIEEADGQRAFCTDRHGSGTTLLLAGQSRPLRPQFGSASAAAHEASRAVALHAGPSLRCDVDTPADLQFAAMLGLGVHTSRVLTRSCGDSP